MKDENTGLESQSVDLKKVFIEQACKETTQFLDFGIMIRILLKAGVREILGTKINNYYYKDEEVQLVDSHGNELENQFRKLKDCLHIETEFGTFSESEFYLKFKGDNK